MAFSDARGTDGARRYRTRQLDSRIAAIEDAADAGDFAGGGGGGPATSLDTTGSAVNVGSASPPSTGQVLTATSSTTATWQTPDDPLDAAAIVMVAHVADPDPHPQYHRTFGSATATFANGADSVIVTVVDGGVSAGATIIPSVSMGARDPDEFEMAPVAVAVGTITAGVGFTLIVTSLDGDAEGDYKINFITSDF